MRSSESVQDLLDLLACPACGGAISVRWSCEQCTAQYKTTDGIPDLRVGGDERTETVRRFYERQPFPGYPEGDSISQLRARAERSSFAALLDRSIPGNARVVDIGCGTGQMTLYLADRDRTVVGADLTRASLRLGADAARRYGICSAHFVETDLQRPGLRPSAFDVVFSSGVVHHTPDPRAAFARVAQLARPGGYVVLGVYNAFARVPSRLRRMAARATRLHVVPRDAVLRERAGDPARRQAWLRDQYDHPEEHRHTLAEVRSWFAENGIDVLRNYPSAVLDDEPADLFTRAADDWAFEAWIAQLGWMWTLGREGGLFFTIGRRT
jgi:SAM-dependent methyltransferase